MRMRSESPWVARFGVLAAALLLAAPAFADSLKWDKAANRVDAEISTLEVVPLLRKVAAATGWEVYVQPGTRQVLHTKFKNLTPGEALERMLGSLSFAVLPGSNGISRLFVYRTRQDDATERLKPEAGSLIENELIVRLKPGEKIEELAARLGAKVVGSLAGSNAYRLRFADAARAAAARSALQSNPSVAGVESNYLVNRPPGADALGVSGASSLFPKAAADGKYIVIGLIDSNVQSKGARWDSLMLPGVSVAGDGSGSSDSPTHGTAMAQTLLKSVADVKSGQNSTTVRVLPVDVYGGSESTSTFDVAKGINEAISKGARIINLSLGTDGNSPLLQETIAAGHSQDVLFFAAAGNEPVNTATYPAAYPDVIAVTAETPDGQVAGYANRGDFPKIGAPDTSVIQYGNNNYMVTGTSVSTAFAAGVAAGLKEETGQSWKQIEAAIRKSMAVKGAPR